MRISTVLWVLFLGVLIFLSFNYHGKAPSFTHRSQIWADKAGYHVYLPFTIIYGCDANAMPDSIATLTGGGFSIDKEKNILHTKYTYGVALMQLPFFLTAHFLNELLGYEASGYSRMYNWAIDVSAVVYLVLSLLILSELLIKHNNKKSVYVGLAFLYLGSNLFYYSIDETGMSHVYSFFLFTLFLGVLEKTNFLKIKSNRWIIALGVIAGLIVLVRPLNILILAAFLFWKLDVKEEIGERFKRIIQPKTMLLLLICFLLVWLPQMIYWKYSEGSYFHYSYGKESFDWSNPQLLKVWFSPSYGAFLFGSISLVVLLIAGHKSFQNWNNYGFYLLIFLVLSYITSCWWSWSFGCSFGMRNLAEYYALFSFLFVPFIAETMKKNKFIKALIFIFLVAIVALNIQIPYSYGGCFLGEGDWDFREYFRLVKTL